MRYILNKSGYISDVSFGAEISCNLGTCTEYTGEIPTGYSSIEEWHDEEIERLNAWKIIDGNLVFDSNKAEELEEICAQQMERNRHVTKGELDNAIANIEENGGEIQVSNSKEVASILPIRTANGKIITLNDSSSFEVERIKITSADDVTDEIIIVSSNTNLLPNESVTQNIGGLKFLVNNDKSISISEKATESGAFTVAGTISNEIPLFSLKANQPYYLTELPSGYKWDLYCYNKQEKEQVYSGVGGIIELTENKAVTFVEISWISSEIVTTENEEPILTEAGEELIMEGEEVASNVTIFPMLNVGNTALKYEVHEENRTVIDLGANILKSSENILIEEGKCNLGTNSLVINRVINTYNPNSVIYAIEDVELEVDYKKSSFDFVTAIGSNGALILKNTADGYGSIRKLTLENLIAGTKYSLTSSNASETEEYIIDLSAYTGTVTIVIENGETLIYQNNEYIGTLKNIYIRTFSPKTYLEINSNSNMICEYMLESDFSIYCTKIEKDASIKIVEDMIQLEVTRASEVEGELSGRITVEAGKIEQIVSSVGNSSGNVTPASIIQAINEDGSSIQISADKVDIEGTTFPEISNSSGSSSIKAYSGSTGIKYDSFVHNFLGIVGITLEDANQYFVVYNQDGTTLIKAQDDVISIGSGSKTHLNLNGTIYINGTEFDGIAKFG